MPAKYQIVPGTMADALAGTGVSGSVVFVKSDGTRRAAMTVTIPTKSHEEIHAALSSMARQYDDGIATPVVPIFGVRLTTGVDIIAGSVTVP
jgi:hypothetical protein